MYPVPSAPVLASRTLLEFEARGHTEAEQRYVYRVVELVKNRLVKARSV